jgi:acetyltransferase
MAQTPLTDPGALLATTHELDSGLSVRLRLTRPSDEPRVREFLERLSPETRERRFLAPMPTVPEAAVRHFTYYDPRERLIVAATTLIGPSEEILGLADMALLATGLAEIGVLVGDEQQCRGLGRLLSETVAWLALQRGATHLKAEMLERNPPMLRLLERIGPTVQSFEDGRSVAYTRLPALRARSAA